MCKNTSPNNVPHEKESIFSMIPGLRTYFVFPYNFWDKSKNKNTGKLGTDTKNTANETFAYMFSKYLDPKMS